MRIPIAIDIENEIREALTPYVTAYCRPLPAQFTVPSIEIRKIGGSERDTINSFMVTLYARAESEAAADELLRKTVGLLKTIAKNQSSALRHVTINAGGSWGNDPARPDLAMCSATLVVVAHETTMEV